MFELLAIILLGVLTRMIFILADSTDKNTYLWFMHIFKTGMKLKNREIPNSVFRGLGGTPPIPHKIFAEIFHEKHWISANMLFNIGADVLAIILVYFHAGYVLKIALHVRQRALTWFSRYQQRVCAGHALVIVLVTNCARY